MKRFLKGLFPVTLAIVIVISIGWYLLEYDPGFTRDVVLQQARQMEENGNRSAAVWLYNFAYDYLGGSDEIAMELAQKFKSYGNYSKAESTLRSAIADGGSVELYMALSTTYVEQGKLRDAVLMFENLSEEMKAALEPLRPEEPVASVESGSYREYLTVDIQAPGCELFVSTDMDYPSGSTDQYAGPITLETGGTVIYAISVGENGLVSPLAVFQYVISDVVEEVTFSDPSFEATVRAQLELGEEDLIFSDLLWTVTELSLPSEVASTKDLKWFRNLETLTVEGAVLDDPQSLSGLAYLKTLHVTGSTVNSEMMQAIGTLTRLESLTLSNCSISSVAAISSLTKLTWLDLSGNAVRDISVLSGMSSLLHLNLRSNALINLEGLTGLSRLEHLDVSYNSLASAAPLAVLESLTYLDLSSNALRSLEGLESLSNLQKLIATYNQLLEIDPLAQCQELTYLDVSHNTLLSIEVVASLTALEELYFGYNEISKLPAFSSNCALRIISGERNLLYSLKNLSGLKKLTHIYMDYNEGISSISSLTKCPSLKEVYVYGTKVRSASALTEKGVLVVYSPAT